MLPWLDSLIADAIFGWRQITKRKMTSAAAVLSLGLGIGACASAFRLIDALLLRPLPVAEPHRLYEVVRQGTDFDGTPVTVDAWAYPSFRLMRAAVKGRAELIAVSYAEQMDLTYGSDQEMEKASLQYCSGWMFGSFGLRPAVGRLLTENDDVKPGGEPYAVLSYDYWMRRFGGDRKVVGRSFRMAGTLYQIVGVAGAPFTGTETGTVTDVFVPTMMHPGATHDDWTWHRSLAQLKSGVAAGPVRDVLNATSHAFEEDRAKGFTGMSKADIERFLDQKVVLEPAAAGASGLQQNYRPALLALAVLVALVLLIACANVANLLTAQAAARAREMALRISIGAGRGRLIQLMLVEGTMLASLAAMAGGVFAWWSAPFVVSRINPPDHPARLALPADWRVLGFGLALMLAVTLLFGLVPALRASAIDPAGALKGGVEPRSRGRSMHAVISLQAAFCFLVLFLAGLFVTTFDRLANRPLGFSPARVVNLETVSNHAQAPVFWDQVADHLRALPGVEAVGMAGWPLLAGGGWNGFVSVNGAPPGPVLAYFLAVSPGWVETMRIPFVEGTDFRRSDTTPGAAIVNEEFVKQYFNGQRPLGVSFAKGDQRFRVVGVVRNAPYQDLRERPTPVAYVPLHSLDAKGADYAIDSATFVVRTTGANPLALASMLRREIPRVRSGFRVSNIRTQQEIDDSHTVRERLLAMLALFFAIVALLLAGIGLYGVLDYSVVQRRREIGIRIAIGAQAADVARRVTSEAFLMVLLGAVSGVALALWSVRYVRTLLYQVNPAGLQGMLLPSLAVLVAALLAAVPAVIRAVRTDPAAILRME